MEGPPSPTSSHLSSALIPPAKTLFQTRARSAVPGGREFWGMLFAPLLEMGLNLSPRAVSPPLLPFPCGGGDVQFYVSN